MLHFPLVGLHTCIAWFLSSVCSHTYTACLSLLLLLFPFACFLHLHCVVFTMFCFACSCITCFRFVSCTVLHARFVSYTVWRACFVSYTVLRAYFVSCTALRACFFSCTVLRASFVSCIVLRTDLRFSHRFACFTLFSFACRLHCLVLPLFCFIACICI